MMGRVCGAALVVMMFAALTRAQTSVPEYEEHRWDLGVWAAGQTGRENTKDFTEAQLLSAGVFIGKVVSGEMGNGWRRGRLEWAGDFSPVFVQFTPNRLYGIRLEPFILRWNFSAPSKRYRPYGELAGGCVRTNGSLPADDTSDFNFTARAGGGVRTFIRPREYIDLGLHWSHMSNANLGVRNPAYNGFEMVVGFHWLK